MMSTQIEERKFDILCEEIREEHEKLRERIQYEEKVTYWDAHIEAWIKMFTPYIKQKIS